MNVIRRFSACVCACIISFLCWLGSFTFIMILSFEGENRFRVHFKLTRSLFNKTQWSIRLLKKNDHLTIIPLRHIFADATVKFLFSQLSKINLLKEENNQSTKELRLKRMRRPWMAWHRKFHFNDKMIYYKFLSEHFNMSSLISLLRF